MGQQVTIQGFLGADPSRITTKTGKSMTKFRVAYTDSRPDGRGGWVDGATSWFDVVAFDRLADNVLASLRKGQRVIVVGDITVSDWSNGEARGTDVEVKATAVGHNLALGTTAFLRNSRPENDGSVQPSSERSWQPSSEASWQPSSEEGMRQAVSPEVQPSAAAPVLQPVGAAVTTASIDPSGWSRPGGDDAGGGRSGDDEDRDTPF